MHHVTSLARRRASSRPFISSRVEGLERRLLFAMIEVTNANDSGPGSLRQAITDANATTAADTIEFDQGFFLTPRTIVLQSPLPQFSGNGGALTITGPGASLLTVRRSGEAPNFRVFTSFAPTLSMSGMTVSGGLVGDNGAGLGVFGIAPTATLDGMVFSGNTAGASSDGGGVYVNNNGNLTIRNSTVSGNTARSGGGIFFFNNGGLLMENCTVSGNAATGAAAGGAGGVFFFGTATSFVIRDSTLDGNTSAAGGGGVTLDNFFGDALIQRSTISGNTAAGAGGGVLETVGTGSIILQNSTLSGNTAGTSGGGVAVAGGTGAVALQNSTVTNNRANGTAANTGGGGLARTSLVAGTLNLVNSVVSGNTNANGPDVFRANANTTVNANFSAIGSATGFALSDSSVSNLPFATNPLLGPLATNGGRTQTHAVLAGSPLADAGADGLVPAGTTTDQRGPGFPRFFRTVDIGSFERETIAPVVQSAQFRFDFAPQALRYLFSESVGASLDASDLRLESLTTGTVVPTETLALSYNAAGNEARFTFPGQPGGVLPDGNYRATLLRAGVTDAAGNVLAADHVFEFFVLAGDINRDRTVNGSDFAILAGNFGRTGRTYAQGDLNGDGTVNGSDFAILAGNFGRSVPVPSPALVAATAAARAPAPQVQPASPAPPARPVQPAAQRRQRVHGKATLQIRRPAPLRRV